MKKQCKLLVSLMMALAMVVSTFAGTFTQGAVAKAATTHPTPLTPAKITDWFATGVNPATVTVNLPGKNGNVSADAESTAVIVPVKMDYTGVLDLGVQAKATSAGSITAALYQDDKCTDANKIGSDYTVDTVTQKISWKSYTLPQVGTFYLKVKWSSAVPAQGTDIAVAAYGYSGDEVTLGKDIKLVWTGNTTTKYHKIVVKSDSQMVLQGSLINPSTDGLSSMSLSLCDKNKKQLRSMSLSSSNKYVDFVALKKGTYYAAVSSEYPYMLSCYANSKVKDQSGASQKKAKEIKKGKTVKGMMGLSEGTGKADWFKVKLPKRKKLKLKYSAICTGTSTLKLQIIPANKKTVLTGATTIYLKSGSGSLSSKSLGKGTYYIKISKTNKSDNGSYSIKYVK